MIRGLGEFRIIDFFLSRFLLYFNLALYEAMLNNFLFFLPPLSFLILLHFQINTLTRDFLSKECKDIGSYPLKMREDSVVLP